MRSLIYFFIVACTMFALSCKTSKKIVKTDKEDPIEISDLYLAYSENKLNFEQVEFTANVEYVGDMTLGFSAIFRIENNKKIWGSFKKFGFEAARMLITPDSIFVLNRLQSAYMAEDIKALQEKAGIPIEFDDLQQMLMGGSFWTANLLEVNDSTLVKIENVKDEIIETKHIFDNRNFVKKSIVTSQKQGDLTVNYDNYNKIENASLAFERNFVVKRSGMNVILDFETIKFDPNSAKTFPFEIPANYARQPF